MNINTSIKPSGENNSVWLKIITRENPSNNQKTPQKKCNGNCEKCQSKKQKNT